jgi:predicted amidophosphoribosyltransferase
VRAPSRDGSLVTLGRVLDRLLSVFVPPVCVACRAPGFELCPSCRRTLPWLTLPQCSRCALPGACCGGCPAAGAGFDRAWAPLAYEGPARALVVALKSGRGRVAAQIMAAQLAAHVAAGLPVGVVLVPVPAHPRRARARGFDHADALAAALARRTGLPIRRCLRRRAGAERQVGAGRSQRLTAAGLDIRVRGDAPQRALLVDDVHTTGATLRACAAALRRCGTTWIGVATYARTIPHTRVAPADKRRLSG